MKLAKLFLPAVIIAFLSCGKAEEKIIDCLGESLLIDIKHSVSPQNARLINFTVGYSGGQQLNNSIKWNFGDGEQQTVSGATANHTYGQAGTYTAIATVAISSGCKFDVKETVNVQ